MSKITEFVNNSLKEDEGEDLEFNLGNVGNAHGQKIASETGIISISGSKKVITSHAIRHAFVRHQTKKSESERGQIGITPEDFDYLADILSNPTLVERGDKMNRKNQDIIKFSKNIKGRNYNVLMSVVRSKEKTTLFFNTMFIIK